MRVRHRRHLCACAVQHELKLTCKHAYVEHIRGRMLRFKLSYETGHRRSRRTIAQGALPLMTVMPLPVHTAPHWPVIREEWPFSIPLYHGCAPASLTDPSVALRTSTVPGLRIIRALHNLLVSARRQCLRTCGARGLALWHVASTFLLGDVITYAVNAVVHAVVCRCLVCLCGGGVSLR